MYPPHRLSTSFLTLESWDHWGASGHFRDLFGRWRCLKSQKDLTGSKVSLNLRNSASHFRWWLGPCRSQRCHAKLALWHRSFQSQEVVARQGVETSMLWRWCIVGNLPVGFCTATVSVASTVAPSNYIFLSDGNQSASLIPGWSLFACWQLSEFENLVVTDGYRVDPLSCFAS